MHVFLIEDNENYSSLIKDMLLKYEKGSFRVTHSDNLKDGIRGISNNNIDVVLLDLDLPDSNGLDTLNTLNSVITDVPIIVLTGSEDEGYMLRSMSIGAQDYLLKSEVTNKEVIRSILYTVERFNKYREQIAKQSSENIKFQNIINDSADGILVIDRYGRVIFTNDSALEILKKTREELVGKPFGLPVVEDEKTEIDIMGKDGIQTVLEMSAKETEFSGENVYVVSLHEITEHKKLQEYFQNLSITDAQTNLYNKRGFETLAKKYLNLSKRLKREFLIGFYDLDGLKYVNDKYGHTIGNMALSDTAAILKKTFRESDILSRWGGDEFAVLIASSGLSNIENVMSRYRKNLEEFKKNHTRPYTLSLSVGFSCFDPENPSSLEDLIAAADNSMYSEKKNRDVG